MKKRMLLCALALLLCACFMTGCSQYKGPYTFWHQNRGNIKDVKIYSYDRDTQTTTALAEVAAEDVDTLLDELSALECFRMVRPDILNSYGPIHVSITYLDGATEIVGIDKIGYVTAEGDTTIPQYRMCDTKKFHLTICQYVDPELLPDLSQEYPGWFS